MIWFLNKFYRNILKATFYRDNEHVCSESNRIRILDLKKTRMLVNMNITMVLTFMQLSWNLAPPIEEAALKI